MKRSTLLLLLAAPVLALTGCYYDNEEELYPGFCDVGDATVAGYWDANVQPIIQGRCAVPGCHVGGFSYGDFTQYTGVKAKVDEGLFQEQVLQLKAMPPTGSLSSCDLQKLQAWVDAGAPQ